LPRAASQLSTTSVYTAVMPSLVLQPRWPWTVCNMLLIQFNYCCRNVCQVMCIAWFKCLCCPFCGPPEELCFDLAVLCMHSYVLVQANAFSDSLVAKFFFSIIVMDIFVMTVHSSAWCYCEWAKRPNLHLCVKFCDDHSNSCRDNSGFSQNGDHPPSWTSYACVWTTQEMYAAVFSFVRKLVRISCVVIKICEFWGYDSLAWKCLFMPLSGEFLWWNGEYGNC